MVTKLNAEQLDIPVKIENFLGILVYSPKLKTKDTDAKEIPKLFGAAFGFKQEELLRRAASEAVERYCGYKFKVDDFLSKSYSGVRRGVVNLKSFIGYKKSGELECWIKSNNRKVHWVECLALGNGTKELLPACLVYPLGETEKFDKYNSSGLAAGSNVEMATTNAICELMERDSIMCSWMAGGANMFKIKPEFVENDVVRLLISSLQTQNIRCYLYGILNDFKIVTIVSVLEHDNAPYYSFGSSCKTDPFLATQRAIEESLMIYRSQSILINNKYKKRKVENLTDHIMSTTKKSSRSFIKNLKNLDFIPHSKFVNLIKKSTFKSQIELINRVKKLGYTVYSVRLSDLNLEKDKYFVVRAVIPGLHPLETNHLKLHLDLRRIKKFVGNEKVKINKIPHPFG